MGASNLYSRPEAEAYLRHVSQAWLAIPWHGDPHLVAAAFAWAPGASRLRLPRCVAKHLPSTGCAAAVCADEGRWFFDLRGVHLKGRLTFVEFQGETAVYGFAEERLRGWDYRFFANVITDLTSPGPDKPLSRARAQRGDIIRIASLSPAGRPHITPLWYHRSKDRYTVQTAGTSKLARNIARHPRVAATISHSVGSDFYPATYVTGLARFTTDRMAALPANLAISTHYFLNPGAMANAFKYKTGWRHVPAFLTARTNPGVVTLNAEITTEVYSAEGIVGEWLATAATTPSDAPHSSI